MPFTAIATIIGAIIGAGAGIAQSTISSRDAQEANDEALRLANIQRQDTLNAQAATDQMNRLTLRQRRREFQWGKEEAEKGRAERAEERGYGRRQQFLGNTLGMVNQNAAMRSNLVNLFQRRRGGA